MSWPPKPPYSDNRCRELAEEGQIWMKWLLENHPNPVRATPTAANVARMAELDAGELRHVPTQRRRLEAKGCCVVPEIYIYIYIPYKYRYIIYTYIYIYIYIYSEVFPNVGLTEVFSEVLNETSRNCWRPWSDWRSPAADGSF